MKPKLRIADLLCGAGGTSSGAVKAGRAAGYEVELRGLNHWERACATHRLNFPEMPPPLCASVNNVNPLDVYGRGELDVLFASPECTSHSNARGGVPMDNQSRATPWCVIRWAEKVRPPVIYVENVREFRQWGPLDAKGKPIKHLKGETFKAWVGCLRSLGYTVDARMLCAADYGAPTERYRLFVQAVCDGENILWPERELSENGAGGLPAWRTARNDVIDWKLKGRWLDEMPPKARYGGLPLSPKTLARIYAGLRKFAFQRFPVQPYIVTIDHQSSSVPGQSVDRPLSVMTTEARHCLVEPFLVDLKGTSEVQLNASARSIDGPLSTIQANGTHHSILEPYLIPVAHGGGEDRARSVDKPLPVVCGNRGDVALIVPSLEPFMVKYNRAAPPVSVDKPLPTLSTKERLALVMPEVVIDGQRLRIRMRWRMLQPHELKRGMSFPESYQFTGNKSEVVKQIGNAVAPEQARALLECRLKAA